MAKESNYLIAQWIETNPGGGVSMAGVFVDYKSETIRLPNGRTKRVPAKESTSLTVKAIAGEDGDKIDYNGEVIDLMQGEFIVPNNEHNVKALKRMCKMEMIMMRDEDLHEEYISNNPLTAPPVIKKVKEPVVEEEEPREASELDKITCLKINRNKVFDQLKELGKDNLEDLSLMTIEQLTTVRGVGEKMAEAMIEEAKALCK